MLTTYEEIETEWRRLSANHGAAWPPEAKAVYVAFMQHTARLPVTTRCIHCGELLAVTDLASGSAWAVTCPCGKSKDTLRGL